MLDISIVSKKEPEKIKSQEIKHMYQKVIVINSGPVKNGPALHGSDIGYVFLNTPPTELMVDFSLEDDGWVPIEGTWKATGEQGWIKKSWVAPVGTTRQRFIFTIEADGTYSVMRIE